MNTENFILVSSFFSCTKKEGSIMKKIEEERNILRSFCGNITTAKKERNS